MPYFSMEWSKHFAALNSQNTSGRIIYWYNVPPGEKGDLCLHDNYNMFMAKLRQLNLFPLNSLESPMDYEL